ncbi:MAG TPA: VCBS repeat-containing protein [Kofleriaceae bacterium]
MRWLFAVAAIAVFIPNCQCGHNGASPDAAFVCNPPCEGDLVCRYDACVPPPTPCTTNADCPGDQYCDVSRMECLPWGVGPGGGSDPECKRDPVPGVFFPGAQCEWTAPAANDFPAHKNVLATPVVATFYSQGELATPSIVFTSYNFDDGGSAACASDQPTLYYGVVRIIDGKTCTPQATISSPTVVASASLAVADIGGADATPEIVAARSDGGLVAWTLGATGWTVLWQTASTFADTNCDWAGPSIHDLDDDGVPEILFYGNVYSAAGVALDESLGTTVDDIGDGYIPVAADIDGDGNVELITGKMIYVWNKTTKKWDTKYPLSGSNGFVAVADFGTYPASGADNRGALDGIAEIALIYNGVATVITRDNRVVFTANLQGVSPGRGGPPTIADFDGDGRVEFASAGAITYNVFDPDCVGTPNPHFCKSMTTNGVLWTQTSQDGSSNMTGSSVFDFDGDGRAEVVYGDECFTRVYDGVSGKVLYSRYRTSCTWYENPVIADVDADFNAEIISTSNVNCSSVTCPTVDPIFDGVQCLDDSDCPSATTCGREQASDPLGRCRCQQDADCGGDGFVCLPSIAPSTAGNVCRASHPGTRIAGIRVLADGIDRWVNTRTVWNQHAYSVTNIDEYGKVPRTSQWLQNWTQPGLNNFRQNSPGAGQTAGAIPDLTIKQAKVTCDAAGAVITAEVCDRGTEPVAPGVPVAIYSAGPPQELRCQTTTTTRIDPGLCASVSCTWTGGNGAGTVVVDDRGDSTGIASECREDNNTIAIAVSCP